MIYPTVLANQILYNKDIRNYIPKKMSKLESLKLFHKYWSLADVAPFKVENIYNVEDTEYYSVKFISTNKYGIISFPLDKYSSYELISDRNDIKNAESIINVKNKYYGSEIKYWFFTHNIDFDNPKYNVLKSYIEIGGKNIISDNKLYFLKADIDKQGNYYNYRFISK